MATAVTMAATSRRMTLSTTSPTTTIFRRTSARRYRATQIAPCRTITTISASTSNANSSSTSFSTTSTRFGTSSSTLRSIRSNHDRPYALIPILHEQRRSIRILPVGKRKHPQLSRFNNHPQLKVLGASPAAAYERRLKANTLPLRTGIIAVKKGMTAVYVDASGATIGADGPAAVGTPMEKGRRIPATVLQMDRVQVVANKTREKHGYYAVVVGEGWRKPRQIGRAMMGVFAKSIVGDLPREARIGTQTSNTTTQTESKRMDTDNAGSQGATAEENGDAAEAQDQSDAPLGLPPKREVREFRVRDATGLLPIGTAIYPSWFQVGQHVDARGTARGMGFAGGMKRYGFGGQPASHGVSLTHRSMGSAGGGQGSGSRVHPGKRMAGNMGGQRHTVQNLKVLMVDEANGLVVVNGCVSGRKGDLIMLSDALKKPWPTASI